MREKIISLLQSRRFWATIGSLIFQVLVVVFKLPITEEQVLGFVAAIGIWVWGDSNRETKPKLRARIR